jgi:hypothetical protein
LYSFKFFKPIKMPLCEKCSKNELEFYKNIRIDCSNCKKSIDIGRICNDCSCKQNKCLICKDELKLEKEWFLIFSVILMFILFSLFIIIFTYYFYQSTIKLLKKNK